MSIAAPREASFASPAVLDEIQRRVLWLATLTVHHANNVRKDAGGVKVGGHQASSASVVALMTYLFFEFLRPGDRISVKPHAAPVLHAVQYLLGRLDPACLTMLRQHHGLQAYPSRTKDPDPVDFSTGSMGLGAVAPNYAALVERFVRDRLAVGARRRYVSLVGDGELDEGSIWETIAEPALAGLDNVIWVVDLNRQSLDRVVPGVRVRQLEAMFRDNGWQVLEAKYGRRLEQAFALRAPASTIRAAFARAFLGQWDDAELPVLIADLGGHDMEILRRTFRSAEEVTGPVAIFAYTIKGWGLPIAGDPLNHPALLSSEQIVELRGRLGIAAGEEWARFSPGSAAGRLCAERGSRSAARLRRSPARGPLRERRQLREPRSRVPALAGLGRREPRCGARAAPGRTGTPVVTVLDGHPSALAWVGSMLGVRAWPLGVTRYGESGTREELYRDCGIDAPSIRRACHRALADRA